MAAKHVVVVMNGLKELTTELSEWALENIRASGAGYTVTLLGLMPWLNIPQSSKTWQDVWMPDFEHLSIIKCVKLQTVLDLCQKHGVVAQKEVVMGYSPAMACRRKNHKYSGNMGRLRQGSEKEQRIPCGENSM
ncbi:hypothetical protein SLA2020_092350 [Shorea laevis]